MMNDEMCLAPFKCRALTGECCYIFFEGGRIFCSLRGCTDTKRQSDVAKNQGFSLQDIFRTTLVTSFMYNVLTIIGATTTVSTTTTTTTTTPTSITTDPAFTSSMSKSIYLINIKNISVTGTAGTFYSINYPGNYSNSYEEHYSISVEDGFTISLYFQYFDIEHHVSCIYDHIKGKLIVIKFFQFSKQTLKFHYSL